MIKTLNVYLEAKKKRIFVGKLERKKDYFQFSYDEKYYFSENPLQVGPGLGFEKAVHKSKEMFSVFLDRIPSKKNAAYIEYCKAVGISESESDVMLLLLKLGSRGPSSFIIEEERDERFNGEGLRKFREELGISLRDFAELFDVSLSSIQRIEGGQSEGRDVLKRIEIYAKFKNVARWEVERNAQGFSDSFISEVLKKL